jgi:hypothetical protein
MHCETNYGRDSHEALDASRLSPLLSAMQHGSSVRRRCGFRDLFFLIRNSGKAIDEAPNPRNPRGFSVFTQRFDLAMTNISNPRFTQQTSTAMRCC